MSDYIKVEDFQKKMTQLIDHMTEMDQKITVKSEKALSNQRIHLLKRLKQIKSELNRLDSKTGLRETKIEKKRMFNHFFLRQKKA